MADPNFASPGVIYVHKPKPPPISSLRFTTLQQNPELLRVALEAEIARLTARPEDLGGGAPFFAVPRRPALAPAPLVPILGGFSAALAGTTPPPQTGDEQQFVDAVAAALPPDP